MTEIQRRFLTVEQAARRYGMGRASFEKVCPVATVNLPLRKNLYDVRALEAWADELSGLDTPNVTPESAYEQGKRDLGAA